MKTFNGMPTKYVDLHFDVYDKHVQSTDRVLKAWSLQAICTKCNNAWYSNFIIKNYVGFEEITNNLEAFVKAHENENHEYVPVEL